MAALQNSGAAANYAPCGAEPTGKPVAAWKGLPHTDGMGKADNMGKIEQLAEKYRQHVALPWQQTIAGAQRILMVVYDKADERILQSRKTQFEIATKDAGHEWFEVDISRAFGEWMASEEYRDAYFESPEDLQLKLESEFSEYVAARIRAVLERPEVAKTSVLAVFGVGTLFGFARVAGILKLVEQAVQGRLVVFFPGGCQDNNYRLLDARDGWNYLAVPITVHSSGGY